MSPFALWGTFLTQTNLQELFHTTVGPVRTVTLNYDAQGRSKGVAAVHFQKITDGTKAFQQYNNRLIDGSQYTMLSPLFSFHPLPP